VGEGQSVLLPITEKSAEKDYHCLALCSCICVSWWSFRKGGYSGGESNCVKQCVHDFPILGRTIFPRKPVNDIDYLSQRVFKWIFEDQAYSPVVWFGSSPTPFSSLPSASCLSFSGFFLATGRAYRRERGEGGRGVRSQTNHTTSRKLGPLQITQYSLTYPIHLFWGKEPCGWYCVCCLAQAI
jgi:hypothetical protein